jgi:aquaporin Z
MYDRGSVHPRYLLAAPFVTEFLGTAYLAWIVGVSRDAASNLVGFAIGAQLLALIYAGAVTSGAHYNPAVTLGIWVRGLKKTGNLIKRSSAIGYVVCQFLGAALGGALSTAVLDSSAVYPSLGYGYTWKAGILVEMFYTGILVFVVLHVATRSVQAARMSHTC